MVALSLRPPLTSVGPLLPQIGSDRGLGQAALGLLGALPLLAFAAVSPFVHLWSRRLGTQLVLVGALLVLAAGTVGRSYTGVAGLWVGTVLVGAAIAVGNVLVPALVKQEFPGREAAASGVYAAFLGSAAALGALVAVPLAGVAGWRFALAVWAGLTLATALLWTGSVRRAPARPVDPPARSGSAGLWRQPTAWLVTVFMGLQSAGFYILVTWLPTVVGSAGASMERAGVHLFVYQAVSVVGGLLVPWLMRRHGEVAAALTASGFVLVGSAGLVAQHGFGLAAAVVTGLGSGASLVVALTLISTRARSQQEAVQLSGMAQSVGYLLAAGGPVAVGLLADLSGSPRVALGVLGLVAVVQLALSRSVVRSRLPQPA